MILGNSVDARIYGLLAAASGLAILLTQLLPRFQGNSEIGGQLGGKLGVGAFSVWPIMGITFRFDGTGRESLEQEQDRQAVDCSLNIYTRLWNSGDELD
ncbi:predicted protein [Sclerotinia sclerotiorum 1980 UF-70]|uniref:Uncharacterized protein n=1 Tax=Sclerotinia sclerotiorum (strain ATCC 18683 / 1980 / Ss-1) TaxID=665079 RepID=A7F8N6_SCLS1|nr:predicted protein [Sclerotinia sclerotiorum 1980 UF-70]EDN99107.1 predicted protein [Sclerotinia sclerotiorum 1980 UF-70]